jgi:hypothetical protein
MKIQFLKTGVILVAVLIIFTKLSMGAVQNYVKPIHGSSMLKKRASFLNVYDSTFVAIENCVGNACGSISITQGNRHGADRLTIRNTGTQSVVISIRFYYAGCQNAMTLTLSAYESEETVFVAFCPPYTANYK